MSNGNELETGIAAEETAADSGVYTHVFSKPFEWMKQTYETMTFDFGKLRGKDIRAIYRELYFAGIFYVGNAVPVVEYLVLYAARAAGIGADALDAMECDDFLAIIQAARNFSRSKSVPVTDKHSTDS